MNEKIRVVSASLMLNGLVRTVPAGREAMSIGDLIQSLRHERNMDRICKVACSVAGEAVKSAAIADPDSTGVFFGSGYGTYPSNLDHFEFLRKREPASPAVFSWTQPNIPAAFISIAHGLRGEILARADGCMGGSKAVESALDFIGAGLSGTLVVGSASTDDPRIASALAKALGGGNSTFFAEGAGFLVLSSGVERAVAVIARAGFARIDRAEDWVRIANQEGLSSAEDVAGRTPRGRHGRGTAGSGLPAGMLIITARPGIAPPSGTLAAAAHFDFGAKFGDLMEAAGPAALCAAVEAVSAGTIAGESLPERPSTALVVDQDYLKREIALFLVSAGDSP